MKTQKDKKLGLVEPIPPVIMQKIKWVYLYGRENWKLCLVAAIVLLISIVWSVKDVNFIARLFTDNKVSQKQHTVVISDSSKVSGTPSLNEIRRINTPRGKKIPGGTILLLKIAPEPNTVLVKLKFPGQKEYSDLGVRPIVNGIVTLPVNLIFLSYAKEDEAAVLTINDWLTKQGYLTWFDRKDLLPGDNKQIAIEQAIENSDFVLVFLSPRSVNKTGNFQRELKYALWTAPPGLDKIC